MYCLHDPGTRLIFKCAPLVLLVGIEPTTTAVSAGRLAAGVLLSWSPPPRLASPSLPRAPFGSAFLVSLARSALQPLPPPCPSFRKSSSPDFPVRHLAFVAAGLRPPCVAPDFPIREVRLIPPSCPPPPPWRSCCHWR